MKGPGSVWMSWTPSHWPTSPTDDVVSIKLDNQDPAAIIRGPGNTHVCQRWDKSPTMTQSMNVEMIQIHPCGHRTHWLAGIRLFDIYWMFFYVLGLGKAPPAFGSQSVRSWILGKREPKVSEGNFNYSNSVQTVQGMFFLISDQTLILYKKMAMLLSDIGWRRNSLLPEFTENLFI